jgi:hypothetical protein
LSATYLDYIESLKSGIFSPIYRVEWLRNDETVRGEIPTSIIKDGNLTISNQNGIRRTCDIKLINTDGFYIPQPEKLWIQTKFKLWLGLKTKNGDFLLPQGVFVLSNPEVTSELNNSEIRLKGEDKFSLLDGSLGGELTETYSIPLNSNIPTVIRQIVNVECKDIKIPNITSAFNSQVTPYTMTNDKSYGDILIEIANMLSCNVYYDVNGRLVFEEDNEDINKSSDWDFSIVGNIYHSGSNSFPFSDIYNGVKVIAHNTVTLASYTATVKNENLKSDTRVQLGFERIKLIEDNYINSIELATKRCKYELKRLMVLCKKGNFNALRVLYHLDVDKIFTVTDKEHLNIERKRYLINQISIPFGVTNGDMSITCVDTSDLEFSNS